VAAPGRQERQVIAGCYDCKAGQWSYSAVLHAETAHSLNQGDNFSERSFELARADTAPTLFMIDLNVIVHSYRLNKKKTAENHRMPDI